MMTLSRIQNLDVQKLCSPDEIRGADFDTFGPRISSGLHHERRGLSFYAALAICHNGMPMAYSKDCRWSVVNHVKQGMTWNEVLAIFRMSRQTLSKWLKMADSGD